MNLIYLIRKCACDRYAFSTHLFRARKVLYDLPVLVSVLDPNLDFFPLIQYVQLGESDGRVPVVHVRVEGGECPASHT
jgi:hypothetical protein